MECGFTGRGVVGYAIIQGFKREFFKAAALVTFYVPEGFSFFKGGKKHQEGRVRTRQGGM